MIKRFSLLFLLISILTNAFSQKQIIKQKIFKYKNTYVSSLKKCINLANDIISLEDVKSINNKRDTAKAQQAKAYYAFIQLQDPTLKFPNDKIKSMENINPIFFGFGVFSDDRILNLPAKEYKIKVQEQINLINTSLQIINKF